MTQITIRSVAPELRRALKQEAARRGVSMNRLVLEILGDALGLSGYSQNSETIFPDLDHLAGTWTQQELDEFGGHLRLQRSIDEELWS